MMLTAILLTGAIVAIVAIFDMLVGLRVVKFGRKQIKIHKGFAWGFLAIVAVHGTLAVLWFLEVQGIIPPL